MVSLKEGLQMFGQGMQGLGQGMGEVAKYKTGREVAGQYKGMGAEKFIGGEAGQATAVGMAKDADLRGASSMLATDPFQLFQNISAQIVKAETAGDTEKATQLKNALNSIDRFKYEGPERMMRLEYSLKAGLERDRRAEQGVEEEPWGVNTAEIIKDIGLEQLADMAAAKEANAEKGFGDKVIDNLFFKGQKKGQSFYSYLKEKNKEGKMREDVIRDNIAKQVKNQPMMKAYSKDEQTAIINAKTNEFIGSLERTQFDKNYKLPAMIEFGTKPKGKVKMPVVPGGVQDKTKKQNYASKEDLKEAVRSGNLELEEAKRIAKQKGWVQ